MSPASALQMNSNNKKNSLIPQSLMKVQVRNSHGDHVTLWTAERALSAVMVPIVPLAFAFPSPTMDYLLAFTFALHSHWGIEAIVVDYVRPSVFGETIPKIAVAAVYGLSALTLGGLFYFVYADVGIVNAIKMLWKL
jgi:succinate dehydrogenase (ubiquinone) membrane anchor subunit